MLEGQRVVSRAHEAVDDVDGNRKYHGGIILGRDAVQSLEVAQLEKIFVDKKWKYICLFCFYEIEIMSQIATFIFLAK